MTTTIDGEQALALIDKAIEKRGGETIVAVCRYEYGGEPCCVVGTALATAGVRLDVLQRMDGEMGVGGGGIRNAVVLNHLATRADVLLTKDAVNVFGAAQYAQDMQQPWAAARAEAEAELQRIRQDNEKKRSQA